MGNRTRDLPGDTRGELPVTAPLTGISTAEGRGEFVCAASMAELSTPRKLIPSDLESDGMGHRVDGMTSTANPLWSAAVTIHAARSSGANVEHLADALGQVMADHYRENVAPRLMRQIEVHCAATGRPLPPMYHRLAARAGSAPDTNPGHPSPGTPIPA